MNDRYTLYHGDCLEEMNKIPDKSIDMILVDPPYNITYCDWDILLPFDKMWLQFNRVIKDNGCITIFSQQPFTSYVILSNLDNFKYSLIWKKEKPTNVFNIKYQFGRVHEDICIFYKNQCTYNPQMKKRQNITNPKPMKGDLNIDITKNITGVYKHSKNYNPSLIYPISVLEFNRDSKKNNSALHPTQKPVSLLEYLIKTFSNENDLILDSTMGSGSTGVACLNTNRKFIGIEKDDKYFEIAKKRIENVQGIW
jgi:DNA modification methylase